MYCKVTPAAWSCTYMYMPTTSCWHTVYTHVCLYLSTICYSLCTSWSEVHISPTPSIPLAPPLSTLHLSPYFSCHLTGLEGTPNPHSDRLIGSRSGQTQNLTWIYIFLAYFLYTHTVDILQYGSPAHLWREIQRAYEHGIAYRIIVMWHHVEMTTCTCTMYMSTLGGCSTPRSESCSWHRKLWFSTYWCIHHNTGNCM